MKKGLFGIFSPKKEDDELKIVTEDELLLTNGRGKNTWWITFDGKTDGGEKVNFLYRLSITSISVALQPVRMFDSLLAVTYDNQIYACERDYGMVKKKQHVPIDFLSFTANLSKLEGSYGLLDLYAVMTNYEVDVAMDYPDGIVKKADLAFDFDEKEIVSTCASDMDCQGQIRVEGEDFPVKGTAWVEKRYLPIGKHDKNANITSIKVWMFPDDECAERIAITAMHDISTGKKVVEAIAINQAGHSSQYEAEWALDESTTQWVSPSTGKKYPLPGVVRIPGLDMEVGITPTIENQEMVAEDGIYGEYAGSGEYSGHQADKRVSGTCVLEMIIQ